MVGLISLEKVLYIYIFFFLKVKWTETKVIQIFACVGLSRTVRPGNNVCTWGWAVQRCCQNVTISTSLQFHILTSIVRSNKNSCKELATT